MILLVIFTNANALNTHIHTQLRTSVQFQHPNTGSSTRICKSCGMQGEVDDEDLSRGRASLSLSWPETQQDDGAGGDDSSDGAILVKGDGGDDCVDHDDNDGLDTDDDIGNKEANNKHDSCKSEMPNDSNTGRHRQKAQKALQEEEYLEV